MRLLFIVVGTLLLASCGGSHSDSVAGGVTPSESQALNDAAEMLDKQPPAPNVLGGEDMNAAGEAQ
jgi:hypothetical protein